MSSQTDNRERVRHWSIIAYLVMLALLLPLTLFMIKQEQHVQTKASLKLAAPTTTVISPSEGVYVP